MLITFEGVDGSGKTTASKMLHEKLGVKIGERQLKKSVTLTREPGGPKNAEAIRNVMLSPGIDFEDNTTMLLAFASRMENAAQFDSDFVICDRYTDSTFAYQVAAGKASPALFSALEDKVPKPDLTIYLDVDKETILERLNKEETSGKLDRISRKFRTDENFYDNLSDGFEKRFERDTHRFIRIDGEADLVKISYLMDALADFLVTSDEQHPFTSVYSSVPFWGGPANFLQDVIYNSFLHEVVSKLKRDKLDETSPASCKAILKKIIDPGRLGFDTTQDDVIETLAKHHQLMPLSRSKRMETLTNVLRLLFKKEKDSEHEPDQDYSNDWADQSNEKNK